MFVSVQLEWVLLRTVSGTDMGCVSGDPCAIVMWIFEPECEWSLWTMGRVWNQQFVSGRIKRAAHLALVDAFCGHTFVVTPRTLIADTADTRAVHAAMNHSDVEQGGRSTLRPAVLELIRIFHIHAELNSANSGRHHFKYAIVSQLHFTITLGPLINQHSFN
ncbi:hypothetical protein BpHYR1_016326 [Brachionus plicatilis]|uniref:Secreted protein n=1 Tax=Brachionus plicatilis TaxID=10195 RepID=A0A3M7STJ4_BRAPC|nr:hypothetical protein BpHYR1_016326 [Brachionus plicatilis]